MKLLLNVRQFWQLREASASPAAVADATFMGDCPRIHRALLLRWVINHENI